MQSAPYSPSLEEQKQYWDRRWENTKIANEWSLKRGMTILTFLRALPLHSPTVLDLGCGTGWFSGQLSQLGKVTGIDLSKTAINLAQAQFPQVTFIAGNLFELSLPAASFDIVISQDVIAHVQDQKALIDRITHILKPEGYLVISTVNKFVIERMYHAPDPREHIKQWLSMKALKRLLQPHFRVLRTTSIIPIGDQGVLRLVNSPKVNAALGWLVPRHHLEALKEWFGFGYELFALAQKRP